MMWNYDFKVPEKKKIRYIIHTDCKNEADDQYTVAHALMIEKFEVKGIIAGHFDKGNQGRFPEHTTADASYQEVKRILGYMGIENQYPVYTGANTGLTDMQTPIVTEAAKFIVEEAMKEDDRPLYIGMQGAITDLACAILMEPEICERMTCIWVGGGNYPKGGWEFNLAQDINAARVVFNSSMPVWQIPQIVYKQFATSICELQLKVKPCGSIGKYLYEQLIEFNNEVMLQDSSWPHGECWILGDESCVCTLLEEMDRNDGYEMIEAPSISDDMHYSFGNGNRKIRVYNKLDVRMDLEDLFAKLKINFG